MSLSVRPLVASDLLSLWDSCGSQHSVVLAMELLRRALPTHAPQELWQLPVGRRDRLLLQLRELSFGPQLSLLATCPSCREQLELSVSIRELGLPLPDQEPAVDGEVTLGAYHIAFRLPTSADLWAVAAMPSREAALEELVARCVTAVHSQQEAAALPEELLPALSAHLAAVDPHSEALFGLKCPGCGQSFQAALDVARLLHRELAAEAERLLDQVATLAAAYGWSEREIVAMSARKRQAYLSRCGGKA
jgi:hypothetical protein